MRAAVVDRYGPPEVVRVEEVPPPEPRKGQVVVRVHAAAVTSADARIRGARFPAGFGPVSRLVFGVRRPRHRVLGTTFSGVVEAVGPAVDDLTAGDPVCGMAGVASGAHAELLAVPARKVVRKPPEVSHEDAAGVLFGGHTALGFLRDKARIGPGTSVLVNGASGAVGTNAVQLARHLGGTVAAATSARNADLVSRLGADRVIDYTRTPVLTMADRFDVVIDTVGTLSPATGRRLLTDRGVLLLVVGDLRENLQARGNVRAGSPPERTEDFAHLLRLVATGELVVVLDRVLDLTDIVAAHRHVDSGRKVGNVLVRP